MKLLVSGCSFTEGYSWPKKLFSDTNFDIKNVGKGASGNGYIANSIMSNLKYEPDFVYILFSGINRVELRTANSKIYKTTHSKYKIAELGESIFHLGGVGPDPETGWLAGYNAIKGDDWPEINSLVEWYDLPNSLKTECLNHNIQLSTVNGDNNLSSFCHQYFVTQNLIGDNNRYYSELTFQNLMNCFNMLEKMNIPYRFSFIYDIFSEYHNISLGKASKELYYNYIDWNKFINIPPYDYGIKYNLLKDGFHLTEDGMNRWATEISKVLKRQSDLQHLF